MLRGFTFAPVLTSVVLPVLLAPRVGADEWPQWRGAGRDGVWRETGLLEEFPPGTLARRWSAPISSGYSGPTVADGRVYVSDRVTGAGEKERVHCFDWKTGERLWTHAYACDYRGLSYPAGPRASITVHGGLAYSLGAVGHLLCLRAGSGEVVWSRDLREEYEIRMPNWGIAAAPLIEGDLVIVQIGGKGNACLVALDRRTGKEAWRALEDDASYSAPIAIEQGGQRVLVCWTGLRIAGLDPPTGRLLWDFPHRFEKWPIAIATPVRHRDLLILSEAHKGTLVLRLKSDPPGVEKVWHRGGESGGQPGALHCLQSTPYARGDHLYGADSYGVLRCLELSDGDQVWEDETAGPRRRWATIHLVPNGDRTWLFNDRGELLVGGLSPEGFREIDRAKLLDPTTDQLRRRDGVTWSHPAFAHRHVFARNDRELVCADLSAP